MRILLVEQDRTTADQMMEILINAGMTVTAIYKTDDVLACIKDEQPDAVVLDTYHPEGLSGLNTLAQLRDEGIKTPIVISSGETDDTIPARAINLGANEFLKKPFHAALLVLAIKTAIKRAQYSFETITVGDLTVNVKRKSAEIAGQPLNLTGGQYAALELLALNHGRQTSPARIREVLYGDQDVGLDMASSVVTKLRYKINEATISPNFPEGRGNEYIQNMRGRLPVHQMMPDTLEKDESLSSTRKLSKLWAQNHTDSDAAKVATQMPVSPPVAQVIHQIRI